VVHFLFLFLFAVKKFSQLTTQKNFYMYFKNCLKLGINIIPFPEIVQYVYTALIPLSYSTRDCSLDKYHVRISAKERNVVDKVFFAVS
jgi:hypothetical protein